MLMEDLMRSSVEIMFWCVILIMVIVLCRVMIRVLDIVWLTPKRIRSMLSKQGIRGPKPSFLYGNVKEIRQMESTVKMMIIKSPPASSSSDGQPAVSHHQWVHSSFPYLQTWSRHYGPIYMFSTGTKQHLYVNQPEFIKELKLYKSLDLGKPAYLSKARKPILGNGIIKANGHHWAHQRKLIAPHFFPLQVKGMVGLMEECATAMMKTWEQQLKENGGGVVEINTVYQDLRGLAIDIISKAFFGSSYNLGKTISTKLRVMEETLAKPSLLFGLPHLRFLPTKGRRTIWRLKKEVEALIFKVIKGRQEGSENDAEKSSKDLLQMMLERASTDSKLHQDKHKFERFMVDTCTNIYFAGSETTAASASWTLMLLALHPEWQHRVRSEIIETCGDQSPSISLDWDKLNQLKTLGNAILESLRLYAPSAVIAREAFGDIKLEDGNFVVPKGVHIWSFIPVLHRDPENWGPDANEFNPERFRDGISEACKYPQMYVPFGYGTRLCLGQAFAMLELKLVLCLLLSRFSFSVSPNYIHSPVYKMLLMPQHGMRLLVKEV